MDNLRTPMRESQVDKMRSDEGNNARTEASKALQEKNKRERTKSIGLWAVLLIVIAAFTYIALIVCGQIPSGDRLGNEEITIGALACIFLILFTNPDAFSRLSLLKLPGGIEVKLDKLEKQQQEQQTYLDAFNAILSNLLSLPEKYHLRALLRGGEMYEGRPSLRDELFRLKRFGLIEEVEGQKIGDLFDGRKDNFANYVRFTDNGKKFILGLDRIERQ
jgi:hypothetical protein